MKSIRMITLLFLMILSLCACAAPAASIEITQSSIEARCAEIAAKYSDLYLDADKHSPTNQWSAPTLSQSSIDAIEELLMQEGYDMIDTSESYPAYLTTTEKFRTFWDQVQNGQDALQEMVKISESGQLSYTLFENTDGVCFAHFMTYGFDDTGTPYMVSYEKHCVEDMELTDRGNFYYRIYPAEDKHYADYGMIRITAPNQTLADLTASYIEPIGYYAVNLFLCDWSETDLGALCLNDLFEYLYWLNYGTVFESEAYPLVPNTSAYYIPAGIFESTIMPYFSISAETFHSACCYDSVLDAYPWRPFYTNDAVRYCFPVIAPEVTDYTENPDGTFTLTVHVYSTDLKTDSLFVHEVTIRPKENGSFQYVSNRIVSQTDYGLPLAEPRMDYHSLTEANSP